MADLDIALTIAGDLGLELTEANGYTLSSFGPGVRSWIKQTTRSPNVHGRDQISKVLDVSSMRLVTIVKALTHATLWDRVEALVAAVEQDDVLWTPVIEGVTFQWRAESADSIAYGDVEEGDFDVHRLRQLQQKVTALVTRHPVPVAGPRI